MFIESDGIWKWNSDYLFEHRELELGQISYKRNNNYISVFQTEICGKFNKPIYFYVATGWKLGTSDKKCICRFCDDYFNRRGHSTILISPCKSEEFTICKICVKKVKSITGKYNGFYTTNQNKFRITNTDVISVSDNKIITYKRNTHPINKISYDNICNYQITKNEDDELADEDYCNFCDIEYDNCELEDREDCSNEICRHCFNYSRLMLIEDNWKKYLLIRYSGILDDSSIMIYEYFIDILTMK